MLLPATKIAYRGSQINGPRIPTPTIVEVAAGQLLDCARRKDGSLWCWGCNTIFEVGDGTKTPRAKPVKVL